MKSVGITGPPGAGKTTVLRAISAGRGVEIAAIPVRDSRLETLSQLHSSQKTTPLQISFRDVHATERTEAASVAQLRTTDAVLIVVPAFGGQEGPKALAAVLDNLVLSDMAPVEARLERARKDPAVRGEIETLTAALAHLEAGSLLRERDWETNELSALSALAPITMKPILALYNVDESSIGEAAPAARVEGLVACALLEAEASGLEPDESREILDSYGISEPLGGRIAAAVLRSLDLLTFFVTDHKETRALGVKRGATALDAAAQVHTDMARGFIRAEVAPFDKVAEAGSWEATKAATRTRVEGKDYVVNEGDVFRFRFSV